MTDIVIPISTASAETSKAEIAEDTSAIGAWLHEIGLPQYIQAFSSAGFDDQSLLEHLTDSDLSSIEAHTGTRILPGHRKKVLLASQQLSFASQSKSQSTAKQNALEQSQMHLPGGVNSLDSPKPYVQSSSYVPKPSVEILPAVLTDSLVSWLPPSTGTSHKQEKDTSNQSTSSKTQPHQPPAPSLPLNTPQLVHTPQLVPQSSSLPTSSEPSNSSPPPPPPPSVPSVSNVTNSEPLDSEAVLDEVKAMIKQLSKREKSPMRSQPNRASAPASLLPTSSNNQGSSDISIDQKRQELEALHGMLESKVQMLKGNNRECSKPVTPPSRPPIAPTAVVHVRPASALQPSAIVESSGVSEIERKIRAKIEEVNRVLDSEESSTSGHKGYVFRAPSPPHSGLSQSNHKRTSDDQRKETMNTDVTSIVAARKNIKSLTEIDREIQAKLNDHSRVNAN